MSEALPAAIVAQLDALGQALREVTQVHRAGTLAILEAATLSAIRAAMPGLLGAVLTESTTSLKAGGVGQTVACSECGRHCPVPSWRERAVTTGCGEIRGERPWYHCTSCRWGWSPADQTWELVRRTRISAGLADWLIDWGASTSFTDAARELGKLTGLPISPETIRLYTEQRGTELETVDEAAAQRVQETRAAAAPLAEAPGTLVWNSTG